MNRFCKTEESDRESVLKTVLGKLVQGYTEMHDKINSKTESIDIQELDEEILSEPEDELESISEGDLEEFSASKHIRMPDDTYDELSDNYEKYFEICIANTDNIIDDKSSDDNMFHSESETEGSIIVYQDAEESDLDISDSYIYFQKDDNKEESDLVLDSESEDLHISSESEHYNEPKAVLVQEPKTSPNYEQYIESKNEQCSVKNNKQTLEHNSEKQSNDNQLPKPNEEHLSEQNDNQKVENNDEKQNEQSNHDNDGEMSSNDEHKPLINNDSEPVEKTSEKEKEKKKKKVLPKIETNNINSVSDKIRLSVGGRMFNLSETVLDFLGIDKSKLLHVTDSDSVPFMFFDRDPYYFTNVLKLIKESDGNPEKLMDILDETNEQFVYEIFLYGLVSKNNCPVPKIRLKNKVTINSKPQIAKINVRGQKFMVSTTTLSKSPVIDSMLENYNGKDINIDVDPTIFRYIINFLRTGCMYISGNRVLSIIKELDIDYDEVFDPKQRYELITENIQNSMFNVQTFNTIQTTSKLEFGSDIVFDIASTVENIGKNTHIDDIVLCIDVPVIKPTENCEYVDNYEYKLVESVKLVIAGCTIAETSGSICEIFPHIWESNASAYSSVVNSDKPTKLIYGQTLIDIKRVIFPLFMFNKDRLFPIRDAVKKGYTAQLVVTMAKCKNILTKDITIPLLNVTLYASYLQLKTRTKNLWTFNKYHTLTINVAKNCQDDSDFFCNTINIPIKDYASIQDTVIILNEESDSLVDLRILTSKGHVCAKLDPHMLNTYIPLRKLGHIMKTGSYYYDVDLASVPDCILSLRLKKNIKICTIIINERRMLNL